MQKQSEFHAAITNGDEIAKDPIKDLIHDAMNGESNDILDFKDTFSDESTTKMLGLGYSFDKDCFYIKVREKHGKLVKTKREVLSLIASVYDPLGFISPFILKSRMTFQRLNEMKIGWKEKVPDDVLDEIIKWRDSIPHLKKVFIPRWTAGLGFEDAEASLCCFSDASIDGYGCCAYVVRSLKGENTKKKVAFLMSKAHVVPIQMARKPIEGQENHCDSIPRLELVASLASAMMRDLLIRVSGENFTHVTMFSDSVTVLKWIGNFQRRFKTFENFRLQKIRNLTKIADWRHVPTSDNPADLCSKGINAHEIHKFAFLHSGPTWLEQDKSSWPPRLPLNVQKDDNLLNNSSNEDNQVNIACLNYTIVPGDYELEEEPEETLVAPFHLLAFATDDASEEECTSEPWPLKLAKKRSVWTAKLRFIALFKKTLTKWVSNHRAKKNPEHVLLPRAAKRAPTSQKVKLHASVEELKDAELLLLRAIQNKHFSKEINTLMKLNVVSPTATAELKTKSSPVTNLAPFIDDENVLRAGSRFQAATHLSFDTKFPIVLPNSSDENVRSLIRHEHHKNMHASKIQTFFGLKKRFFILGGKQSVNRVIARCVDCQRVSKQTTTQRMGNLPPERANIAAPFRSSGLDVFGPYTTKVGRIHQKRWCLIMTCFSTRAVALMPLRSMDSDSVIRALVKLDALFPGVKNLHTDNGTNFIGANNDMHEARKSWNDITNDPALQATEISWSFGPAKCGSAGGVWERLIKSAKQHLKTVMKTKELDADSFETVIFGIMAIMNRRPLTPASSDVDDHTVLSPAHFLYPHLYTNSSTALLPPSIPGAKTLKNSWKRSQEALDEFWRLWSASYLETLRKSSKWKTSTEGPEVGTLVLIADQLLPREHWRMGRVVDVINGDEQHPRRFLVRDSKGRTFDRHTTGLVCLELEGEEDPP